MNDAPVDAIERAIFDMLDGHALRLTDQRGSVVVLGFDAEARRCFRPVGTRC